MVFFFYVQERYRSVLHFYSIEEDNLKNPIFYTELIFFNWKINCVTPLIISIYIVYFILFSLKKYKKTIVWLP